MQRDRGGYTVIEVLIVLFVSGAILISAVALFRGKQGQTQFNQAMYDLDSKIQSYINDVRVSQYPEAERYECFRNTLTDRPYLQSGSQVTGSSEDCIFLGKAVQVAPGSTKVHVYSVLGNRTYAVSGLQREPATSFDQTNPEPAQDSSGNFIYEAYDTNFKAAELVWARVNGTNEEYDLLGFYNSLQTSTVPDEQGSQSLLVKSYRLPVGTTGPAAAVENCIEEQAACTIATPTSWTMCFRSDNGKDWAILTVNNSPAGVGTELQFKPDPAVCPG